MDMALDDREMQLILLTPQVLFHVLRPVSVCERNVDVMLVISVSGLVETVICDWHGNISR